MAGSICRLSKLSSESDDSLPDPESDVSSLADAACEDSKRLFLAPPNSTLGLAFGSSGDFTVRVLLGVPVSRVARDLLAGDLATRGEDLEGVRGLLADATGF